MLTDPEDRYDVRVMQLGRRLGLTPEPLQVIGIRQALERKRLQGHAAAQRFLDCLVDDAHAAAGDFAKDAVLPQSLRRGSIRSRSLGVLASWRPGDRAELLGYHQRGEEVTVLGGKLWVLTGVLGRAGPLAATEAAGEFISQFVQ